MAKKRIDEVLVYLDYYEHMAPVDTDRTTLTVPDACDGTVILAAMTQGAM